MPSTAVVGLKPEEDPRPLIELAQSVVDAGAAIHLLSLVRVTTGEDERQHVQKERARVERLAEEVTAAGFEGEGHVDMIAVAAGAEIVRIAERLGADLIVIGLGKRSRVGKALLGSDAQRVLLSAHCPVLSARLH